jgi:hypothetical protein
MTAHWQTYLQGWGAEAGAAGRTEVEAEGRASGSSESLMKQVMQGGSRPRPYIEAPKSAVSNHCKNHYKTAASI